MLSIFNHFRNNCSSSLGNLTEDEFVRLSSEDSTQHLLVAFVTPSCKKCQEHYYPLVQALHAFRGVDVYFDYNIYLQIVTATIDLHDAEAHLGECDINMESELPEIRLYKAGTGVCLESPDKHFSVNFS